MNRGSGNDLAADESRSSSGSFNEAPIHESGKFDRPEKAEAGFVAASMRPRFMNRGSEILTEA